MENKRSKLTRTPEDILDVIDGRVAAENANGGRIAWTRSTVYSASVAWFVSTNQRVPDTVTRGNVEAKRMMLTMAEQHWEYLERVTSTQQPMQDVLRYMVQRFLDHVPVGGYDMKGSGPGRPKKPDSERKPAYVPLKNRGRKATGHRIATFTYNIEEQTGYIETSVGNMKSLAVPMKALEFDEVVRDVIRTLKKRDVAKQEKSPG